MDGEEMKNSAVDSGALAKAALAAVMAKPGAATPAVASEMLALQAELAALKAKLGPAAVTPAPKKGVTIKVTKYAAKTKTAAVKPVVAAAEVVPMTPEAAKKYVAKFAGKKGRRPAAFYEAQKIIGLSTESIAPAKVKVAKPAKVKAAKPAKAKQASEPQEAMTVEAATKYVASFAGKKGRRPAAFYEAQKIAGLSTQTVAPAKTDKVVAKVAKAAAKLEAKALKASIKAEAKAAKAAAQPAKSLSDKKTPSTGQSGSVIKDLTAEDLNTNETALMLAFGTEGHRTDKAIKDLAAECFPHKKKAQANSWARNGLRRLVRAKLVEKDARGVFKQSVEGRNIAKKLSDMKAESK